MPDPDTPRHERCTSASSLCGYCLVHPTLIDRARGGRGRPSPVVTIAVAVVVLAVLAIGAAVALHRLSGSSGSFHLVGTERTYTYCHNGGIAETLELYEPLVRHGSAPTLVDIHGGGWISGDADLHPDTVDAGVEQALVAKGWVFASINYRLAPTSRWPAQIEDTACAIRFLRTEAAALDVDPNRIGIMGASAGGQLAAMVGLTGGSSLFTTSAYPNESSAVDAVVDEYGPTDLTAPDLTRSKVLGLLAEKTFGVEAGHPSTVLAAASPITYVHPGAPPFLVIQGAEDSIVPPSQSTELVARLEQAHDTSTLIMVEHAGHGLVEQGGRPIAPDLATLVGRVDSFLTGALSPHR